MKGKLLGIVVEGKIINVQTEGIITFNDPKDKQPFTKYLFNSFRSRRMKLGSN